jgi:DNA-binding transcriptional MerR regulator
VKIGQLATASGLSVQTIRYYERRGLLRAPRRLSSGYRDYPAEALEALCRIKRLQELGFTLAEARQFIRLLEQQPRQPKSTRALAEAKICKLEEQITRLRAMRDELRSRLIDCLCCNEPRPVDQELQVMTQVNLTVIKKQDPPESAQESPFACQVGALSAEEWQRHHIVTDQLHELVCAIEELPDGYAYRFQSQTNTILLLSEFISRERRCCPFLGFELVAEQDDGTIWLRLRGRDGAKEFIRSEIHIK